MLRDCRKHVPLSSCFFSELLEMECAVGKASVLLHQSSLEAECIVSTRCNLFLSQVCFVFQTTISSMQRGCPSPRANVHPSSQCKSKMVKNQSFHRVHMTKVLHMASVARGTTGCELKFSILVSQHHVQKAADFIWGSPGKCFISVWLPNERLLIIAPVFKGALTPLLLMFKEECHLQYSLNSRETSSLLQED